MARPLPTKKNTVDLGDGVVRRVSRIRRDPSPPPEKPLSAREVRQREAWTIAIGIAVVAAAMFILVMQLGSIAGWELPPVVIHMR